MQQNTDCSPSTRLSAHSTNRQERNSFDLFPAQRDWMIEFSQTLRHAGNTAHPLASSTSLNALFAVQIKPLFCCNLDTSYIYVDTSSQNNTSA